MALKHNFAIKPILNGEPGHYALYKNGKIVVGDGNVDIDDRSIENMLEEVRDAPTLTQEEKDYLKTFIPKQAENYENNQKKYESNTGKSASKVSETKSFYSQTNTTDLENFVVNDMTTETSIYKNVGMQISNLVYPSDLLNTSEDNPSYNGCYTIFFISEHTDSSIVTKESASKYRYNGRNGFIAEDTEKYGESPKLMKSVGSGLGVVAAYQATNRMIGPMFGDDTAASIASGVISGGVGATLYTANIVGSNKTQFTQLKSCIALPTPALQQQNNIEWSEEGNAIVNNIVSALHKSSSYVSNVDLSLNNTIQDFGSNVAQIVSDVAKGSQYFGSMVALSASSMGVDILQKMAGKVSNSRKEQLFKDVNFRKYRFSYDMYARDEAEMQSIQSIIQVLKYHAHPELSNSDFLYIYPAQFDIVHYFNGKPNPYMPKHATSVLTGIDIQYGTNDVPTINRDGSPTLIKLDLEFTELAILNKKDIAEGY